MVEVAVFVWNAVYCSMPLRTQAWPAIAFVSGEGLRPKSYFFEFSFLDYVFTESLKYEEAPGPNAGQRGDGEWPFRRPGFPRAGGTSDAVPLFSCSVHEEGG